MTPGTTVRYTRLPFPGRTGTVVEPLPRDAAWPGYVRVQLDTAPDGSQGARLQLAVEALERVAKVGQLGLFGSVSEAPLLGAVGAPVAETGRSSLAESPTYSREPRAAHKARNPDTSRRGASGGGR